jgi:hypothetical protein
VTGTRTLLSTFSNATQGPLGDNPTGVAVEASGFILVIDYAVGTGGNGVLFRVDPATGNRTLLSDFGNSAQGPTGVDPVGVAVEASGFILVIDEDAGTNSAGALFRVDPVTGNRTLLSNFGDSAQGDTGIQAENVAVEAAGTLLVIASDGGTNGEGELFRLDPVTGNRTQLSNFGQENQGPKGTNPTDVAVEASGFILVSDPAQGTSGLGALFRVDPATGNRTLFSDFGNPAQGPTESSPEGVAVEASGTILVMDAGGAGKLFRVDPVSGNRTLLSDFSDAAQGPTGSNPWRVAVLLDDSEPPPVHDLAVTKITAPATVTLTNNKPQLTKPVTVQIQNRSPHDETIPDLATLGDLVILTVTSRGSCLSPSQELRDPGLPKTLKPKKTLNVVFDVTFDCANDPVKGAGHEDYDYSASVDHAALDGEADTHPEDDSCPRDPLGIVPNPDGTINDKGCLEKVTDVFDKRTIAVQVIP